MRKIDATSQTPSTACDASDLSPTPPDRTADRDNIPLCPADLALDYVETAAENLRLARDVISTDSLTPQSQLTGIEARFTLIQDLMGQLVGALCAEGERQRLRNALRHYFR